MNNDLPVGSLKTTPESFVVQEIVRSETDSPRAISYSDQSIILGWDGSPFTVFSLSKRDWGTEDAMNEVARQLGVSFDDDISYHGLKDKVALTSQLIAVRGKFRPKFSHRNIYLAQLYGQDFPLQRGGNLGNRFNILVRSKASSINLAAAETALNFFGPQRLGSLGSEQAGRFLLEGEVEEAIMVIINGHPAGAAKLRRAKELAGGEWEDALSHPSFRFSYNFQIEKWQSFLWNKLLEEKKIEFGDSLIDQLPTLQMWNTSDEVSQMYKHIWNPDHSKLEPKALRVLNKNKKGRSTIVRPENLCAEREEMGWRFNFDLFTGAYATVLLSQLFKLDPPRMKGRGN